MILHEAKPAAEDVPALENAAPEDGEAIVPRALGPRHLCHTILYMYIHVYTCIYMYILFIFIYIYISKGLASKRHSCHCKHGPLQNAMTPPRQGD